MLSVLFSVIARSISYKHQLRGEQISLVRSRGLNNTSILGRSWSSCSVQHQPEAVAAVRDTQQSNSGTRRPEDHALVALFKFAPVIDRRSIQSLLIPSLTGPHVLSLTCLIQFYLRNSCSHIPKLLCRIYTNIHRINVRKFFLLFIFFDDRQ